LPNYDTYLVQVSELVYRLVSSFTGEEIQAVRVDK
jgi:hypothetical protein